MRVIAERERAGRTHGSAPTRSPPCGRAARSVFPSSVETDTGMTAWNKPNTGASYPVIVDDDILNLPIPLFPEKIQTEIQQKITESFRLRKQSKYLLESAKRAVEIGIDEDEQTAIEWLESETGENESGRADT